MKEIIIEIQEKENGTVLNAWDYGTEEFEDELKEIMMVKIKEKKLPWYMNMFIDKIFDFVGEALTEAIEFLIEKSKEKTG